MHHLHSGCSRIHYSPILTSSRSHQTLPHRNPDIHSIDRHPQHRRLDPMDPGRNLSSKTPSKRHHSKKSKKKGRTEEKRVKREINVRCWTLSRRIPKWKSNQQIPQRKRKPTLIFIASIIPDIDLLIPGLKHRGPTHSIIICSVLLISTLLLFGKKVTPYFIALAQHSLVGDFVTGGAQLLWPLSSTNLHIIEIEITAPTNVMVEWILFLLCFTVLLKTQDARMLFLPDPSNLILSVAMFTILLPLLISFPTSVPPALIIPHIIYLVIFIVSILTDFKAILKKR